MLPGSPQRAAPRGQRLGAAPDGRPRPHATGPGQAEAPPPLRLPEGAEPRLSRERPLRRSRAERSAGGRSHGVGGGGADAAAAARGRLRPARGLRPQRAAQDPAGVPAAGAVSGGASGGGGAGRLWGAAAGGARLAAGRQVPLPDRWHPKISPWDARSRFGVAEESARFKDASAVACTASSSFVLFCFPQTSKFVQVPYLGGIQYLTTCCNDGKNVALQFDFVGLKQLGAQMWSWHK